MDTITITKFVHDTIYVKSDNLELVNSVQTFYETAWNKLLTILSVLGSLVVLIVPVVIAYIQSKQLKLSKEELTKEIANAKTSMKDEMKETIANTTSELKQSFDKKIDNTADILTARSFGLAGFTFVSLGLDADAISHLMHAAYLRLRHHQIKPAQNIFNHLNYTLEGCDVADAKRGFRQSKVTVDQLVIEFQSLPEVAQMVLKPQVDEFIEHANRIAAIPL